MQLGVSGNRSLVTQNALPIGPNLFIEHPRQSCTVFDSEAKATPSLRAALGVRVIWHCQISCVLAVPCCLLQLTVDWGFLGPVHDGLVATF
jgi:hypothetical protein